MASTSQCVAQPEAVLKYPTLFSFEEFHLNGMPVILLLFITTGMDILWYFPLPPSLCNLGEVRKATLNTMSHLECRLYKL